MNLRWSWQNATERHRTTEQTVWKWCEFQNLTMSCSGLDPCLRRRGAGRLRDRTAKDVPPQHNGLKASAPGYIHIVVKYPLHMANGTLRAYLFVAINRASRRVFIAMYRNKTAATAWRFLGDLERRCPIRIRATLTNYGKAFTGRLFGVRRRAATRQNAFDTLCLIFGI